MTPGPGRSLSLTTIAVAALALAACQGEREADTRKPAVPASIETPRTVEAPAPSAASPAPLSRAEFLAGARQAASDFAAGRTPEQSDPLVGRTFAIRSAFGCGGPTSVTAAEGLAAARWGAQRKTVDLTLTPDDWIASPSLAAPKAEAHWEAIEGFWLARPWLETDACPATRRDPLQATVATPSPQTVGLAVVYDKDASRVGRRNGRAFTYTVRGEGEAPVAPSEAGYRLEMRGRIVGFPDGRAFRCSAASPDQRPTCVAAVALDDVLFMTADGQTLSQWRGG